jgi:catechol 2,3-dioxygenase-like lactoylglutathione lyase family enzyme
MKGYPPLTILRIRLQFFESHRIGARAMEKAVPIFPVDDLAVAKEFYVAGLGFEVRYEMSNDGKSGILGLERGTIYLTLDSPMSGHGRDACLGLEVGDADAYYNEWRARVDIKDSPKNEEWGARTFSVIDPFGNTIFVMGPVQTGASVAKNDA